MYIRELKIMRCQIACRRPLAPTPFQAQKHDRLPTDTKININQRWKKSRKNEWRKQKAQNRERTARIRSTLDLCTAHCNNIWAVREATVSHVPLCVFLIVILRGLSFCQATWKNVFDSKRGTHHFCAFFFNLDNLDRCLAVLSCKPDIQQNERKSSRESRGKSGKVGESRGKSGKVGESRGKSGKRRVSTNLEPRESRGKSGKCGEEVVLD